MRTGRLRPASWPVRWRLAAASAGLTLGILLVFGTVIGRLATDRIRSDFNGEVQRAAQTLAAEVRVIYTPTPVAIRVPHLNDFVLPGDASARIFDVGGGLLRQSDGALALGLPRAGISTHNGMRVATAQLNDDNGNLTGYVQYGRSLAHVDSTINRLWLFVFAGILGGTLLATLAGLAIADRAMRPVGSLTTRAREIAETRDPSRRMPEPKTDDEVGELARTLEQMLRSLDAARAERENALQKQREFVADASHELRTPLTSVLANLELLQASLRAPEQKEDREMVDSALRSSKRMSRLVADLLLLARADAGRMGTRRHCDLAEIAGNAAAEVAPTMGDRELGIDNGRPIFIEGNPDELHRLIVNLLDNAAHHTPPGSHIDLSLRAEDDTAVLEVADDGPGIPAEQREAVFDRFVRGGGPADVSSAPGTGLGLAIVRAVAAAHDATVEAAESPAGGALFRIRFKADLDQRPNLSNGRDTLTRRGSPPKPPRRV
jgi:two-component system, OmpR family, sensor kinase